MNGGTPIAGWFRREHPIKMDDDWGYPPFMEASILSQLRLGHFSLRCCYLCLNKNTQRLVLKEVLDAAEPSGVGP